MQTTEEKKSLKSYPACCPFQGREPPKLATGTTCEASSWANFGGSRGFCLLMVSQPDFRLAAPHAGLLAHFMGCRPVSLLPTSLTALGDPMDCHPKKVLVSKKSISCLFLGFPLPPAFPFMVAAANEIGSTPCSFLK
jgi:hypothetical protein